MRFTLIQYSNQFALGGWSWTVLTYRVQRKVLTSDLGRSYLLPTRASASLDEEEDDDPVGLGSGQIKNHMTLLLRGRLN